MEVTKSKLQLSNVLERMAVYVHHTPHTLMRLGTSAARRLQGALHSIKTGLRKLVAISLNAAAVTDAAIGRRVWIGSQQMAVHLGQAQNTLIRLGRSVLGKPRRLQEALRARENGLRMLLASSLDAIVVINGDRRFVGANPKALDLFGISEMNMGKFIIDVFLSRGQIPKFDGNDSRLLKRLERHGKCEIRRLDGSLRVAEYIYVSNFAPFRHLCRFRSVTATDQYRPATLRALGINRVSAPKVTQVKHTS